jgi:hypothetical protein
MCRLESIQKIGPPDGNKTWKLESVVYCSVLDTQLLFQSESQATTLVNRKTRQYIIIVVHGIGLPMLFFGSQLWMTEANQAQLHATTKIDLVLVPNGTYKVSPLRNQKFVP